MASAPCEPGGPQGCEAVPNDAETNLSEALPLLDLPEQVLVHIVEELSQDPPSLRHLRASCKTLGTLADMSCRHLWVNDDHAMDEGPSNIELLALRCKGGLAAAHPRVRALTLRLSGFAMHPRDALSHLQHMGLSNLRHLSSLSLLLPASDGSDSAHSACSSSSSSACNQLVDVDSLRAFFASLPSSLTALSFDHFIVPRSPANQASGGGSVGGSALSPRPLHGSATSAAATGAASTSDSATSGSINLGRMSALDLHGISQCLSALPSLVHLDLSGGVWLACPADVSRLASLSALRQARDVRLGCGGFATLCDLTRLTRLDLRLECSSDFDASHIPGTSAELLASITRLSSLRRVALWEYQSPVLPLLTALAELPYLEHLSLYSLDDYYITDHHLRVLATFPSLTHLGTDRLDIQDHAVCLPRLASLDISLTILSFPRLAAVFPAVAGLHLRYLWEAAMRKVAGWHSLTRLHLGNLAFCIDWGLLRTLTSLTHLTLARGASYEQLCELLYLLRALPRLSHLTLASWQCARSGPHPLHAHAPKQRHLPAAATAAAAPAAAASTSDGSGGNSGAGGDDDDASSPTGGTQLSLPVVHHHYHPEAAPGTTTYCPPHTHGAASASATTPSVSSSYMAGGAGPSMVRPAVNDDHTPYSMTTMAACLDAELYDAVAAMRGSPAQAPALALRMLGSLPALTSLELSDCANAMVAALSAVPPLRKITNFALSKQLDLLASDVAEVLINMPGLRQLRLVDCWPVTGAALMDHPAMRARRGDLDVLLHGEPPEVHGL